MTEETREKQCFSCGSINKPNAKKCGKCDASLKQKVTFKVAGLANEGWFESIVDDDSEPAFLVKTKNRFEVVDQVFLNRYVYVPKNLNQIPYRPYKFCKEDPQSIEQLFWAVRDEFFSFVDFEDIWKDVCAACVLLSYQQEKLQTVPYIYVYGDNESGKTTVLNVLKELCYRPLFGVTIPAADLYGYLEDADCTSTILEDEIQGVHKDIDKLKIYKSGYKRGATVPRTIMLEHDRIIKYYNTFCFKAVASEQIPTVKGFAERFILIPMTEGYPPKEWADITIEDHERFQKIRSMLLKWRLITREDTLPNISLQFKGRLKELWKPLLQVTNSLSIYDILFNFIENQRKERISNKQNTLEGHIVKAVAKLYEGKEIAFLSVWDQLIEDLEGKVDEKKPNKMDTPEFGEITKQKVGYRLREVLNGEKKLARTDVGPIKVYIFNDEKLGRIIRKYGFEDFVTELPSEPSSSGAPMLIQEREKTFLALSDTKNYEKEAGTEINDIINSKNKISEDSASIAIENIDENAEKHVGTPQELGYIENSVTFLWRRIPPGEKCEQCGARCVEYEITDMIENQVLRKCDSCFKEMHNNFKEVLWREQKSTF